MIFQIKRTQQLNCSIEKAWEFFSSPLNLSKITPSDMNFKILTELKVKDIYDGLEIDYTVSPLFGIPLKWKTVIKDVKFLVCFSDYQQKGPFEIWSHKHEFVSNEKGTLMTDTVDYKLPLGIIGNIAHKLLVKRKVESIFDFRYKILEKTFNKK